MDSDFEYKDRLRSANRKKMIIAIYSKSTHYSELVELTGLKPGSIYHHLKVLVPLIKKEEQGIYSITPLGQRIVESMELVNIEAQKPNVKTTPIISDDMLELIWIGPLNRILIIFVLIVTILLATQGVALAGSAIYSVPGWTVLLFDITALLLGWGVLYTLELITPLRIYNEKHYPLTIRLISMLPGAIVGLGLYLMFISGIIISNSVFPYLFVITTLLGLLVGVTGEYYLRSQTISHSVKFVSLPVFIDMLLGIAIILSSN